MRHASVRQGAGARRGGGHGRSADFYPSGAPASRSTIADDDAHASPAA